MRAVIAGLWFLLRRWRPGQPSRSHFPFNDAGVTMGHWHIASRDVQANKKIFVAMGGTPVTIDCRSRDFPWHSYQSGPGEMRRGQASLSWIRR